VLTAAAQAALDEYDPLGRNRKPGSGGRTGLWVGVGLVLAMLAGGGLFLALRERGSATAAPLQAQVESTDTGGLAMTIAVPGQAVGTVVRYGHQQQTLDAQGRARFVLDDLGNRIGIIDLPIEIAPANASPSRRTARIVMAYRVDPDLTGLASDPPTLRLVFHVVPGARLEIDQHPIATDASGTGIATLEDEAPMPVDGPATRERTFHLHVRATDGTEANGTYTLRVPRSALALDRPVAPSTLTSADRLVVRGQAPGATRVTVNTVATPVQDGTFETTIALPSPGHVPLTVVAYSPTGAPASTHVDIERIASNDTGSLNRFLATNSASVADLAQGSLSAGRRLRLSGRVLGAPRDHEGAQTFQLIVNDRTCPGGRCLAWVDTEPGQTASADSTVDVVGFVTGRRTSVNANGERRSDPVIHAVVLR
jgi:hypothetical protein